MTKNRLEAFSDGVFAIIITITVLEIKVPHGNDWAALLPLIPIFGAYLLSFVYVAIYWNNHHHMFHAVEHVDGPVLWANAHLLFWLSLLPFCAAWIGEHGFHAAPVALYGIVFTMAGASYLILERQLLRIHGVDSLFGRALGDHKKEKISLAINALSIPLAFVDARVSFVLLGIVGLMWIIPDQRIEKKITQE